MTKQFTKFPSLENTYRQKEIDKIIMMDIKDKWEFLIDKVKGQKVSKCETCEYFGNMRLATTEEIKNGYAKEF